MLVQEIMKTKVITLPPDAQIVRALQLLNEHHIRHIPIVDANNAVIGIVSDRDVRDASPSIFNENVDADELKNPIRTIMSHPVVTIHPLDFVEEIAAIFYEEEFACLPVVSEDKLVGIVTEKDMLHTLIQLTGTHVQSSQIEIKVPDVIGILAKVTAIFGKRKVKITSVLIYPYKDDPKYKILVFRIQTMNPLPTIQDLRAENYEVLWPNVMEHNNEKM
ncbi:acetoin utilization AcuB family protein [Aquibacillus koreensis]|uniref:Acetoin utilization AcuB family protein n=1 Tax=Aquibacillus koreensis TaxID=279446 RepID=A0A9X3WG91_9BACI|nr:acetoin utilization AcuB family protein [Aquibacillus koreensis]MCT2535005.1 acetoin utilization AcuB family protein [Aquibacillus koreensis]MDC3419292.1 acetoin utilization AcuB family protein [Aquibacillus koreensis]